MVFFIEKVGCQNVPRVGFEAARLCQGVGFVVSDFAKTFENSKVLALRMLGKCPTFSVLKW